MNDDFTEAELQSIQQDYQVYDKSVRRGDEQGANRARERWFRKILRRKDNLPTGSNKISEPFETSDTHLKRK